MGIKTTIMACIVSAGIVLGLGYLYLHAAGL